MDYFPTHSPLHVTYIQLGVGVSLVVLEEHVSYNDSQSAYNPTTNVIRKIQNKERIGKKITIRVGCSKCRYKFDTKSARFQLVKLLIFNVLYCKIAL